MAKLRIFVEMCQRKLHKVPLGSMGQWQSDGAFVGGSFELIIFLHGFSKFAWQKIVILP